MRQYDQRLLNTVYWSLGVLATVAVFLVGFGWFANFRQYERDKTALRQELRTFIQEEFSRIQGVLQVDMDKRHEAVSKSVRALVSEASDAIRRELMAKTENLGRELKHVIYRIKGQEAMLQEEKGVLTNALRCHSEMIVAALELDPFWVSKALDEMHRVLKSISQQPGKIRPDAEQIRQISEILNKIPPEHSVVLSSVRDLLAAIRSM